MTKEKMISLKALYTYLYLQWSLTKLVEEKSTMIPEKNYILNQDVDILSGSGSGPGPRSGLGQVQVRSQVRSRRF